MASIRPNDSSRRSQSSSPLEIWAVRVSFGAMFLGMAGVVVYDLLDDRQVMAVDVRDGLEARVAETADSPGPPKPPRRATHSPDRFGSARGDSRRAALGASAREGAEVHEDDPGMRGGRTASRALQDEPPPPKRPHRGGIFGLPMARVRPNAGVFHLPGVPSARTSPSQRSAGVAPGSDRRTEGGRRGADDAHPAEVPRAADIARIAGAIRRSRSDRAAGDEGATDTGAPGAAAPADDDPRADPGQPEGAPGLENAPPTDGEPPTDNGQPSPVK